MENAFCVLDDNFWQNARVGNRVFRQKIIKNISCLKSNICGKAGWGNAFPVGRRIAEKAFHSLKCNLK